MVPYPKLVAFDLDGTAWYHWLNGKKFKNLVHHHKKEDNLEPYNHNGHYSVRDKRNHKNSVTLAADFPRIITELVMRDILIAIVSRNTNKALCDRALWYFKARDPKTKEFRPITDFIKYDEVKDESKQHHFKRIQKWSGLPYYEMLIFDDRPLNLEVETWEGVTFKLIPHEHQHGMTWNDFIDGIAEWRRNQHLQVPFTQNPPKLIDPHPNKMLIGYVGTDIPSAKAYASGKRRPFVGKPRPARWGYGLYVSDNPQVAMFFSQWLRSKDVSKLRVCEIYARDKDVFMNDLKKIWYWPEHGYLTNNMHATDDQIGKSQLDRDAHIQKAFHVKKPYILFSRHNYMSDMGKPEYGLSINPKKRFNEMVIYPQIQDALMYGTPFSLLNAKKQWKSGKLRKIQYEHKIKAWKILVPDGTKGDCEKHGEHQFFK
ncbi:hypothetical protein VKT23_016773 [Stygiomarasmius scandens]|uniref:Uncharacterized protein n=1 Tax=Marasmiellus scandens TaxID=2682957 RepID=A0ABR1IW60_9AGAR